MDVTFPIELTEQELRLVHELVKNIYESNCDDLVDMPDSVTKHLLQSETNSLASAIAKFQVFLD